MTTTEKHSFRHFGCAAAEGWGASCMCSHSAFAYYCCCAAAVVSDRCCYHHCRCFAPTQLGEWLHARRLHYHHQQLLEDRRRLWMREGTSETRCGHHCFAAGHARAEEAVALTYRSSSRERAAREGGICGRDGRITLLALGKERRGFFLLSSLGTAERASAMIKHLCCRCRRSQNCCLLWPMLTAHHLRCCAFCCFGSSSPFGQNQPAGCGGCEAKKKEERCPCGRGGGDRRESAFQRT